jgi:hypothetical protein
MGTEASAAEAGRDGRADGPAGSSTGLASSAGRRVWPFEELAAGAFRSDISGVPGREPSAADDVCMWGAVGGASICEWRRGARGSAGPMDSHTRSSQGNSLTLCVCLCVRTSVRGDYMDIEDLDEAIREAGELPEDMQQLPPREVSGARSFLEEATRRVFQTPLSQNHSSEKVAPLGSNPLGKFLEESERLSQEALRSLSQLSAPTPEELTLPAAPQTVLPPVSHPRWETAAPGWRPLAPEAVVVPRERPARPATASPSRQPTPPRKQEEPISVPGYASRWLEVQGATVVVAPPSSRTARRRREQPLHQAAPVPDAPSRPERSHSPVVEDVKRTPAVTPSSHARQGHPPSLPAEARSLAAERRRLEREAEAVLARHERELRAHSKRMRQHYRASRKPPPSKPATLSSWSVEDRPPSPVRGSPSRLQDLSTATAEEERSRRHRPSDGLPLRDPPAPSRLDGLPLRDPPAPSRSEGGLEDEIQRLRQEALDHRRRAEALRGGYDDAKAAMATASARRATELAAVTGDAHQWLHHARQAIEVAQSPSVFRRPLGAGEGNEAARAAGIQGGARVHAGLGEAVRELARAPEMTHSTTLQ